MGSAAPTEMSEKSQQSRKSNKPPNLLKGKVMQDSPKLAQESKDKLEPSTGLGTLVPQPENPKDAELELKPQAEPVSDIVDPAHVGL